MIALDQDTIQSVLGRFNVVKAQSDDELLPKGSITNISKSLVSVQNAFNQIKAYSGNIVRLEKAKIAAFKNNSRESAIEAIYRGPGAAAVKDTSGSMLDALPEITKLFIELKKNLKKFNPNTTTLIPVNPMESLGENGSKRSLIGSMAEVGAGALAAGAIRYTAYQMMDVGDTVTTESKPAGKPVKQPKKNESNILKAIKPIALSSGGMGLAAVVASKAMGNGKQWTEDLSTFISKSVNDVSTWMTSFGSWLKDGLSAAGGYIGDGIGAIQDFGEAAGMASGAVDAPYDMVKNTIGASAQEWDVYRNTLAKIESGGNYDIAGGSSKHYDGRYQMGRDAKITASQTLKVALPHDNASRQAFRSNPQLQERAFAAFTAANHRYLMKNAKYQQANTQRRLQILGYAHNQGAGGANKWLNTGRAGSDGFGTSGTKYSQALASNFSSGAYSAGAAVGNAVGDAGQYVSNTIFDTATKMINLSENNGRQQLTAFINRYYDPNFNLNTPWCAAFANAVLASKGIKGTGSAAAISFKNYGGMVWDESGAGDLNSAAKGDIAVFRRSQGTGHVAFVDSINLKDGTITYVGGNQSDKSSGGAVTRSKVNINNRTNGLRAIRRATGGKGVAPKSKQFSLIPPVAMNGAVITGAAVKGKKTNTVVVIKQAAPKNNTGVIINSGGGSPKSTKSNNGFRDLYKFYFGAK